MAKKLSRRKFLKCSAVTAGAAAVAPWMRLIPGTNVAWAAGPSDAIVVFVQLYGGNDGINTVYPLSGGQRGFYESFRPTLALPANNGAQPNGRVTIADFQAEGFAAPSVLSIGANANGSTYALHPSMNALHGLYQAGKLAVVPGVHYPYPDHSHFRSEQIYYSLDPTGAAGLGWFGKYLNYAGFAATEVPAVNLGESINPSFLPTNTSTFAFRRLSDLEFPAEGEAAFKQAKFRALYAEADDSNPTLFPELVKIAQTGVATIDTMEDYYKPGDGLANAGKVEALLLNADGEYGRRNDLVYLNGSPLNAADNPNLQDTALARDMRHVAATIRANVGARFFHVATGGFDSHSAQENGFYHSYLLSNISECVAGLYNELAQTKTLPGGYSGYLTGNLANKVVIVTFSEFGRTIRQNAAGSNTAGTDHAACSPQFVVGGTVIGGQYAPYPLLDDPRPDVDDDLKMSVDVRDVFGTILRRWLNVPLIDIGPGPGKILPATPTPDDDGNDYTALTQLGFLAP